MSEKQIQELRESTAKLLHNITFEYQPLGHMPLYDARAGVFIRDNSDDATISNIGRLLKLAPANKSAHEYIATLSQKSIFAILDAPLLDDLVKNHCHICKNNIETFSINFIMTCRACIQQIIIMKAAANHNPIKTTPIGGLIGHIRDYLIFARNDKKYVIYKLENDMDKYYFTESFPKLSVFKYDPCVFTNRYSGPNQMSFSYSPCCQCQKIIDEHKNSQII